MQDVFPVAFLPEDHALAIAIMSYNGKVNFGLLGDYDALPGHPGARRRIEHALAELVASPEAAGLGKPASRAPAQPRLRRMRASGAGTLRGCRPSVATARTRSAARGLHRARCAAHRARDALACARRRAHDVEGAMPLASTPSGAVSADDAQRERRASRAGTPDLVAGPRRSSAGRVDAAPASRIPQPRPGSQPVRAPRRAVSLSRRMTSAAFRSGLSSRTIAAVAATIGLAIEVPCT
jgi:hypothetical protein